ncbi:unnamed protein product [Linum trigynum]|uniref:Uncharacterized protein n=1 Tax=Linum trigynum TaxID=586398 RepID=A0AAV2D012_9ROSI
MYSSETNKLLRHGSISPSQSCRPVKSSRPLCHAVDEEGLVTVFCMLRPLPYDCPSYHSIEPKSQKVRSMILSG